MEKISLAVNNYFASLDEGAAKACPLRGEAEELQKRLRRKDTEAESEAVRRKKLQLRKRQPKRSCLAEEQEHGPEEGSAPETTE